MSLTIEKNGLIKLNKYSEKMVPTVFNELEDTGIRIRNQMINLMVRTPKTGRHYKQGTFKRGKKKGQKRKRSKMHIASTTGRAPAVDTGRLKNSIKSTARKSQLEVEVGSSLKNPAYGIFLEEGTKRMEPRPFLEPAVATGTRFMMRRIDRALSRLK